MPINRGSEGRPGASRLSWLRCGLWLGILCLASGCQTAAYYSQAIHGELQILAGRESIPKLMRKAETPPALKERFERVMQIREFARRELHLPVAGHYETYTDVHRPFVVWNVYAAPEFSLESKSWWYPIVGSVTYRGYFSEAAARAYAATLEKKGLEVYVGGVDAYSTLGWFRDPVLSTFIDRPDAELAEIIFHELTHQKIYVNGDTDFNEALATAVADEGVHRWMVAQNNPAAFDTYMVERRREEQFVALITGAIAKFETLYAAAPGAKGPEAQAARRTAKQQIIAQLRDDYEGLKREWDGYAGYDHWMSQSINNAQLNTIATYYDLVPQFRRLLEANGGDLERFFKVVDSVKRGSNEARRKLLKEPQGTK